MWVNMGPMRALYALVLVLGLSACGGEETVGPAQVNASDPVDFIAETWAGWTDRERAETCSDFRKAPAETAKKMFPSEWGMPPQQVQAMLTSECPKRPDFSAVPASPEVVQGLVAVTGKAYGTPDEKWAFAFVDICTEAAELEGDDVEAFWARQTEDDVFGGVRLEVSRGVTTYLKATFCPAVVEG